jgi:hypothetical protein
MMKRLIILIGLLLVTSAQGSELEIIDLKHRSAEELIPVIRPLLDKDEMVSGMNYQLILRASPRNIAQIRRLLEGIDTLPRRLKITVMQNVDSETVARLTEVSGSVGLGRGARLTLPGSGAAGQDNVSARIISTRSLEDDKKTQQLQVLEGNRALVKSGQTVPVRQPQVVQNAWGTQVINTTQYRDVDSGFYVLPRINGDIVTLQISAQNDSLPPNQNTGDYPVTRTQQTTSTVSGRLGEWINVGGMGQQGSTDNSTITMRSTSRLNEQRNVLIKVEEVN